MTVFEIYFILILPYFKLNIFQLKSYLQHK